MNASPTSLRLTLARYRHGGGDPTTLVTDGEFWRATLTPQGPATLHLDWRGTSMQQQAWGPGAAWLLDQIPALTGARDPGHVFETGHPEVLAAQRNHPRLRLGASGTLYHELLPTILAQRVTAGEALHQWHRLVYQLGEKAPGPLDTLRLPPTPQAVLAQPSWWWHRLGVELKRVTTLRQVSKHDHKLHDWASLTPPAAAEKLNLLAGLGPWTIGTVMSTALGDPDAVAVGDYHLKNVVVHALTGRARGTDEEMLELLTPYAGQRGRAVWLLLLAGHRAPKFGPGRRVSSITQR